MILIMTYLIDAPGEIVVRQLHMCDGGFDVFSDTERPPPDFSSSTTISLNISDHIHFPKERTPFDHMFPVVLQVEFSSFISFLI